MNDLSDESQRRQAIAWALALTASTPLAPRLYEQSLLERYAVGELSLEEVLVRLQTPLHQVLYRSQALQPLDEAQLQDLLEQSRPSNYAQGITGLLCHSQGHFLQLLEGPPEAVHTLYTKIRADRRHHQIVTLRDRPTPQRGFAEWRMAFVPVDAPAFYWLGSALAARSTRLSPPPVVERHLHTLLHACGSA